MSDKLGADGQQLKSLIDEEKMKILDTCVSKLSDEYRDFIQYWLDHPGSDASDVANHFGISLANAWTRKHRAIHMVRHCVQKKLHSIVRKVPPRDL